MLTIYCTLLGHIVKRPDGASDHPAVAERPLQRPKCHAERVFFRVIDKYRVADRLRSSANMPTIKSTTCCPAKTSGSRNLPSAVRFAGGSSPSTSYQPHGTSPSASCAHTSCGTRQESIYSPREPSRAGAV